MTIAPQLSAPLYGQVRWDLYERIRRGEFSPGASLPSEERLCAEYGVSRITIRRALDDLCADRVLFRRHGVGTFVAAPVDILQSIQLRGVLEEVLAFDRQVQFRFVEREEVPAEGEMAAAFGDRAALARITALARLKGEVFAVAEFHLPAAEGQRLRDADFSGHVQPILRMSGRFDRPIARAAQTMQPAALDARLASHLEVDPGVPVIQVARSYYDDRDRLLAVVRGTYHPTRYCFRVAFETRTSARPLRSIRRPG